MYHLLLHVALDFVMNYMILLFGVAVKVPFLDHDDEKVLGDKAYNLTREIQYWEAMMR